MGADLQCHVQVAVSKHLDRLVLANGTGSHGVTLVTAAKVDQSKVGNTSVAKAAAVISPSVVTIDTVATDGEAIGTGIIVAIIYLLLGLPFVRLARWTERRLNQHHSTQRH